MKQLSFLFLVFVMVTGCSESKESKILANRNFNDGDWLFVNVNYAEKTLKLIDDEAILKDNPNGIDISSSGECGGTTCDGFLMLYKNGKLVAQDEYLSNSSVFESLAIKNAYKPGNETYVEPKDKSDFEKKWDSLLKRNSYPTIYHTQPDDKDIILSYKKTEN